MKRAIAISMGLILLCSASAGIATFVTAKLVVGDGTTMNLRIWDFEDRSGNPPLFVSQTATADSANAPGFYTLIPAGEDLASAGLASSVRLAGRGAGVGATLYAENDGEGGTVWGANPIAVTYNGAPAVGMEVNGFNYSEEFALVRGIDIVNGGSAPTEFGLGIMTSNGAPAGQPRHGIVLGGPEYGHSAHAPASETGILIDQINSGEAIQIAAGDFITLDGDRGQVRLRYNPEREQIEFWHGSRVVQAIALGESDGD